MEPLANALFTSDLWLRALEKYASDTHLSVKLFDADERVVFGPINPTPLFKLFDERGYDPGIFAECARRCLDQTNDRPAVMVSEIYGLTVVGTSLVLEGKIVGAAVGGYAFADFSQLSEVRRLAKDAGIKFERLWDVAREQKPVPKQRLMLNGELLQVLGDALLRENYRTRQYEDAVRNLEETLSAKGQAQRELQQTTLALNRELMATRELQSASAMLLEGRDEHALYQKIVDAAAAIMRSDMASMQMLFPERGSGGELRLLAQRGFSAQAAAFWEWVRADSACSCGAALKSRTRVVAPDVQNCDFMAGTEDQAAYLRAGIRAVQSTPLLSRDGNLLGMISTHWSAPHAAEESELIRFDVLARQAADLIERTQAEAATRSLAAIVESSDDAIISKDLDGIIISWNPGAERLFGYPAQEAIGRPITMLMPPERLDEEPGILERLRRGESIEHYETVRRRKDGTLLDISLTVSPIRNSQGVVVAASKVARDITYRKQAEAAAKEQEERLRKVEKLASAGQLAAALAHEINNPLSSVTNSLYLIEKRSNLDESARFFVTTAATELGRVSRIVKQSLSYYRAGTTPRDLDLGEIVNESLQIFGDKIQNAGIELRPKVHKGTRLLGFPDELRQVIDNLLLNALEAMPSGGRLGIAVHDSFDWQHHQADRCGVRLTISDTGCGIPKENRRRIFEPFFTTKTEKGTGLGLWILQGIVAKHDGVMSLRSSDAEGKSGTVVSIFLPSNAPQLRRPKPSSADPRRKSI